MLPADGIVQRPVAKIMKIIPKKRLLDNILLYIFAASIPNEMKKNELTRKLAASGCYICRNGANHEWWYSPLTDSRFPISRHGVNEIPKGTLKSIEKQSGIKLM